MKMSMLADVTPTTPNISFMDGMKITNRLIITRSMMVTRTWRHRWNFVFLASSNNEDRTVKNSTGTVRMTATMTASRTVRMRMSPVLWYL